jgi:hypothetical protein
MKAVEMARLCPGATLILSRSGHCGGQRSLAESQKRLEGNEVR